MPSARLAIGGVFDTRKTDDTISLLLQPSGNRVLLLIRGSGRPPFSNQSFHRHVDQLLPLRNLGAPKFVRTSHQ
jgi:hypothetical protein